MSPVDEAKRNFELFTLELGIEFRGMNRNYPCPFHEGGNSTPSMTIFVGRESGEYVWNCRAGCGTGTVIEAMARRRGVPRSTIVAELMRGSLRPAPSRVTPKVFKEVKIPVVDHDEVDTFVRLANENFLSNYEAINKTWGRGITPSVAQEFNLGFMCEHTFRIHRYPVLNFWSMPIPGPDGLVVAVRTHKEAPKKGNKSGWAPFGREPKEQPRQAYFDFTPTPEYWRPKLRLSDDLFLCGGGLKAYAAIGAGLPTTTWSGGESFNWTQEMVVRFSGLNVTVIYDKDLDKELENGTVVNAGRDFRDKALHALYPHVRKLKAITLGRVEEYVQLAMEKIHGA